MHTNQTLNPECTTTNTMLSSAMDWAPLVLIRVAWCPFVVSSRFASWPSCAQPPSGGDNGRFLSVKSVKSVVQKPRLGLVSGFELRIWDLLGSERSPLCPSVSVVEQTHQSR